MEPIRKAAALFLALAIAFLSACGTRVSSRPTVPEQDLATAEPEESPDTAGESWETLPPEGELAEWLGWDKATLESYLRHRLAYALICAGCFDVGDMDAAIDLSAGYTLDTLPYSVDEDGMIVLDAGSTPGALRVDTDLRAIGRPDQQSEEEIRAWLCQGDSAWFDANVAKDGDNHSYIYCNRASFKADGTCEMYASIRASDVTDEGKGTYTISGDRLTIQLTSLLGMEGDLEEENVAFVWHPADETYEYQLIPTATGFSFLQTSENGFWYPGEIGEAMAWQKGYPEAPADIVEAPRPARVGRLNDAEIGQICDQIVDHYDELWDPPGEYVCFDGEVKADGDMYTFILRYQMSGEEQEERFESGGFPEPNIYVMEVYVDAATGNVTDERGGAPWKIFLL